MVSPIWTSSKNCIKGATLVVSSCSAGLYVLICSVALTSNNKTNNSSSEKTPKTIPFKTRTYVPLTNSTEQKYEDLLNSVPDTVSTASGIARKYFNPLQCFTICMYQLQCDVQRKVQIKMCECICRTGPGGCVTRRWSG